jgi:thiol-disulfide isomerase/thioredoxin
MARILLRSLTIVVALAAVVSAGASPAASQTDAETSPDAPMSTTDASSGAPWWTNEDGEVKVDLYFVWSSTCPHCREAHPFVESLEDRYPWLRVHWLQVNTDDPAPAELAVDLATSMGAVIQGVPTFMWCGNLVSGYDDDAGMGAAIEKALLECRAELAPTNRPTDDPQPSSPEDDDTVAVPIMGDVDAGTVSLPTFTVLIAAIDAFNPCAFFVLLFLLSLLVHARSRVRMAVVGGTFVLFSGLIYFLFMTAWLNVFIVSENIRGITLAAGLVAVVIAAVNLKDAFGADRGPSLSIPERAKPGLYARMRALVGADRYPAMLAGTVALAIAVNSYELLCTAGLPMAFTRVLTLNELSTGTYYLYLLLYNVVYVIPLLLIVGGFVLALGSRKLQEYEGRSLKLLSGTMMLGLGLILLFAPDALGDPWAAIYVVIGAVAITLVVTVVQRARTRRPLAH